MITQETLRLARAAAEELRRRGERDRAAAIEALVAAGEKAAPALDVLIGTEAGDLLGVSGQTIKHWVRRGRTEGCRVGGRIVVPKEAVAEYARRARGSLDLEDVADEEAARLVAEGRRGR